MLGSGSVFPIQLGGGPSPTEQAYAQMRDAMGDGGRARDESGIDGLWRFARAKGLAAGASAERRALLQANPAIATDLLPYYERVLQVVPPAGATLADRAAVVAERWNEKPVAATPDVATELEKIDSRLSLIEEPEEASITSQYGRSFEAHNTENEPPEFNYYSGRRFVEGPNFSTRQVVRVLFELGYPGVPNATDKAILLRVRRMLRRALPSDTSFTISTGPWVLGVMPIGLGAVA